jgi:uncharacterized protein YqjF (DUF2071 family)
VGPFCLSVFPDFGWRVKFPTAAQRLAEREPPSGPVLMRQRWERLLFLHWAWDAAAVQRTLPPGLTVDTFDGRAWVGVVPFFMRNVRPVWFPAVPGLSNFLELNVRTYVFDDRGRPGIWFYSLDCNQPLAVKAARTFFYLRYEHAEMEATIDANRFVDYRCQRGGTASESRALYRETGEILLAPEGTLEFFLIERYRLFSYDAPRGRLFTGRVWHEPYRVRAAEVPVCDDVMLRFTGLTPSGRAPDHVRAAEPVNVRVFSPELVGTYRGTTPGQT